jgi:hypothetical protein
MDPAEFACQLERRWGSDWLSPPEPRALADLLRFTYEPSAKAAALLGHVHRRLLAATWRHARTQTAYYASSEYASFMEGEAGAPPDLRAWPILERRQVIERFDDFIASDVTFASVSHTSGATGPSLSIYKSVEELRFLWAYHERLMEPAVRQIQPLPLILSLPNLYHGVAVRLPSLGRVFVGGVTDDLLASDAIKVLEKSYRLPGHDRRISMISGLSYQLKFFTSFLIEQGYEPKDFGVRSLTIIGNYTSRLSHRFLADSWQALVLERFTLTESAGGALRCLSCGCFHLDPHVVGEVVDVDTGEVVEEGVGALLLTQLHPFVQMQPLLRYRTGDLVRRRRTECSVALTFEFLGKIGNCVGSRFGGTRTEWLLFSVNLYEAINELPDIRPIEGFPAVRGALDRTVGAPFLFTQSMQPASDGRPCVLTLTFELRYAPHCFPRRVEELRDTIRTSLLEANNALARRVGDGSIRLEIGFVGPGALGDSYVMKI